MQGYIAKITNDKIWILTQDGSYLDFQRQAYTDDLACLGLGCAIEYELSNHAITKLYHPEQILAEEALNFNLPGEFLIYKSENLDEAQLLVNKSSYKLTTQSKYVNSGRYRLMQQAKKLGANALVNYQEKTFIKNSIGFSYTMLELSAQPATIALYNPKGIYTKDELENSIDRQAIARLEQFKEKLSIGRLTFKICCVILFAIFVIGFFVSSV